MATEERVRERRDLTEQEIQTLETSYSLKVQSSQLLKGGMRSNTAILYTDRGECVVKIYPGNFERELITFQAKACNYLRGQGNPVPEVFENDQGKLTTAIGDTHCVLMERLPGESPPITDDKIGEYIFGSLARVTRSFSNYSHGRTLVAPELQAPLTNQVDDFLSLLSSLGESKVDPFIWQYQDRLREVSEDIFRGYLDGIRKQLVLGDYNLGSVLVDRGKVSGIIDFDLIHEEGPGFDFMHSFDLLHVDKSEGEIPLEDRVDWEKLGKSMGIYSEAHPEIIQDLESFPTLYKILGLRNLIDVWGNFYRGDADGEFFQERKLTYIPRIEIPMAFGDRIVETLKSGLHPKI